MTAALAVHEAASSSEKFCLSRFLHVRPDAHKRGTRRLLMREAAAWCTVTRPTIGIYLFVMRANANAIAFYERLGGVNVESVDHPNSAGGGTAHVYRYAWADPSVLMLY